MLGLAKKKTFEEVKKTFEDNGYTLLETTYEGQSVKMRCICPNHPNDEIYLTYKAVKRGGGCRDCGYEKLSQIHRHDIEFVEEYFEKKGYKLLDKNYINSRTPLKFLCPRHPDSDTKITLSSLMKGYGCRMCGKEREPIITFEDINKDFNKKGYVLLEDSYKGYVEKHRYMCKLHPHRETSITISDLRAGYGCKYCSIDRRTGKNNVNWEGGTTPLMKIIRGYTKEWRAKIIREQGEMCFLTGQTHDIEVHHINPLLPVAEKILNHMNFTKDMVLGDISETEREILRNTVKEAHKTIKGVPLQRWLHERFHSIYGRVASEEDFKDFCSAFDKGDIVR